MRSSPLIRLAVSLVATAAAATAWGGAGVAHASIPSQAAEGKDIAVFIRTDWWPRTRDAIGLPVPRLKHVVCPRSIPATAGDLTAVVASALPALGAGKLIPTVDDASGVFTCVGRLDGQRLLVAGALNEAGETEIQTASLILDPASLEEVVARAYAVQMAGDASVACTSGDVVVTQHDEPVRCKVNGGGVKTAAEVTLDERANVVSVEFRQK